MEKAAAAAEAAQKECASWKSKHEAALERTNQLGVKVGGPRAWLALGATTDEVVCGHPKLRAECVQGAFEAPRTVGSVCPASVSVQG